MKMYIAKGLIFLLKESEVEKNQTKENWMSKKDLSKFLTMKKVEWEEVTPRNQGKWKGLLENREQ